ncbi:MAG: UDP-2,3-diacylglucosamine diphosphatase [Burkholderiales bacterium]
MYLFISDLHLSPERPQITRQFLDFLRDTAQGASALYILGDLFDAWAGDDDLDAPLHREIADSLRQLRESGPRLYLMHGNRDFLFGAKFAQACGAELLSDPTLIDLFGTRTLLMHGDLLCTDDVAYQNFRAKVRHPVVQALFRLQPLALRKRLIGKLRSTSESAKSGKSEVIMDVSVETVEKVLRENGCPRLIHGHTHRPARHVHRIDGRECERWVLSDWYERGSYLLCDETGCRSVLVND